MTGPGPHLTPEREAEIREDVALSVARVMADLGEKNMWLEGRLRRAATEGWLAGQAALDAERADHAQTRAALEESTRLMTRGLAWPAPHLHRQEVDACIQDAQRALGLVRPAPETT